jgi:hypothetical protein
MKDTYQPIIGLIGWYGSHKNKKTYFLFDQKRGQVIKLLEKVSKKGKKNIL